jgi:hypothetical protein
MTFLGVFVCFSASVFFCTKYDSYKKCVKIWIKVEYENIQATFRHNLTDCSHDINVIIKEIYNYREIFFEHYHG